jgi:hypothetical protein
LPCGKIYEIYKRNIYGVIGTLVFHILLFSIFLLADIERKGNLQEEELLIELPELIAEPEITEEEQEDREIQEKNPGRMKLLLPWQKLKTTRRNIASNRLAQNDKFFNEDYMREVEDAKNWFLMLTTSLQKKK